MERKSHQAETVYLAAIFQNCLQGWLKSKLALEFLTTPLLGWRGLSKEEFHSFVGKSNSSRQLKPVSILFARFDFEEDHSGT